MNDIRRLGGWSALLHGIAFLIAFALFIPTFTAMPAEAMEPGNYPALLAAFDNLGPAQRGALALGFSLQTVGAPLMFPAFLAVYGKTRKTSEFRAALAAGMAALGIPFLFLVFSSGFTLLELSEGFGAADAADQAARAAAYASTEFLSLYAGRIFYLFFVWPAVLWLGLMRRPSFTPWLRWVGLGAGLFGVISAVGSALVPALGPITALVDLLLIGWFVGLGISLLRSGSEPD